MDNECGRNRKTENSQVSISLLFQATESRGPQVENEDGYRIQLRARIEAGELVEKAILALELRRRNEHVQGMRRGRGLLRALGMYAMRKSVGRVRNTRRDGNRSLEEIWRAVKAYLLRPRKN